MATLIYLLFKADVTAVTKTKTRFTFIGNNSINYMSIIIDIEDSKINNLYECGDFKNQQTNLNLNERIYIDNEFLLPF